MHQKVIEFAPSVVLSPERREQVCQMAVKLMESVHYQNAATVEFLETPEQFYFIEVNPRIQVEHTVTELITGIDLVKTQLQVAAGEDLHDDIHLPQQADLKINGAAIQCRVTTEDPANNFMPDTGKITTYQAPGGPGVRLDGNVYPGYQVTEFFDSLLVKCCTKGEDFNDARIKMVRALKEFVVRGVKTNIPFMENVLQDPTCDKGDCSTTFIDETPSLFDFTSQTDPEAQLVNYISNVTVNGFASVEKQAELIIPDMNAPRLDQIEPTTPTPRTVKDILDAEGAMCFTGDFLDPNEHKYTLKYYLDMAQSLIDAGAQMIGIKDMAGLLKLQAAYELIGELKAKFDVPVHLHTHDTTGNGVATYMSATKAGVDIVDVAMAAMAGTTSQPSLGTFYYALEGDPRQPKLNMDNVARLNNYWANVRPLYKDFSNGVNAPQPDLYQTEMPGGQYSNLQQQSKSLGINDFSKVEAKYREVNQLLGNIIKVNPSSKVVGDMAIFMIQNQLDKDNILTKGKNIDFPDSVVNFFAGDLGQPYGGFPADLQKVVLKDHPAITVRPGSQAEPVDFAAVKQELANKIHREPTEDDLLGYIMYPKVFVDYFNNNQAYGPLMDLDTTTYYQGMRPGESLQIQLGAGKEMLLKLLFVSPADAEGMRTLYYELDGQAFQMQVKDQSLKGQVVSVPKADPDDPSQIGMPLNGTVVKVNVKAGDQVKVGDVLVTTEAMKMESAVKAPFSGAVKEVFVKVGDTLKSQDLLITLEQA